MQRLILICQQMDHAYITSERGELLAGIMHAASLKRERRNSLAQVQRAAIIRDGIFRKRIVITQVQIAKQLITAVCGIGPIA